MGTVAGWWGLVADTVPAVIRDPGLLTSRAYHSVCEAVLSKAIQARRRHDSTRTYSATTSRRSG